MQVLPALLLSVFIMGCSTNRQNPDQALYESKDFTLYPDKVVQGEHVAEVKTPFHITSNYQSPVSETYSRLIHFKFSINEKDNELPQGQNHWVLIGEEKESSVITFGETPPPSPEMADAGFLSPNYGYTFRVDMSPVLNQFAEQGYYQAFDGTRVAQSDFKGFYIAGGAEPMTWDFVNLGNRGLKLQESDTPGIYTITLTLNPYNPAASAERSWQLELDISDKPKYTSEQPIVDALFNLSLEEALKNIESDSTLRTGAKWGGVWTRDISYSIYLAFAYHDPEIAKISLMKKVRRERIIQDTGSGGAWPVSSDRTTWAIAAWELYKITGDRTWLRRAYTIIKNTLDDDYKTLYNPETGLFKGESSFLDWREQTYPKWMSNVDIYVSENLGTNVVHYQAHRILAEMAGLLGEPGDLYARRAEMIKKGINNHLWQQDRGFYAQFLYGRPFLSTSPRFEALGEALAVIFDISDTAQSKRIVAESPATAFGTTCIYPQIPGIAPYHNNGIWPFVQAYWNIAAAKAQNEEALTHGLASIYRAGGLFLTNYENFVADNGDFEGTEINSHRMLWSMAGNLAMVHRVFMGMSFEADGIAFAPVIPEAYSGKRTLSNFTYRDASLDITVHGFGARLASITLDGVPLNDAFLPASTSGRHEIVIHLDNQRFSGGINMVENRFSLPAPAVRLVGSRLQWEAITDAIAYEILRDGELLATTGTATFDCDLTTTAVYQVRAVDEAGWSSFASAPVMVLAPGSGQRVQAEAFYPASTAPYSNYLGEGFIALQNDMHRVVDFPITVPASGTYLIDFRYSNGSGPWNTENKCAIRSLYVDGDYQGVAVLPQRGTDEWSDWGWSNAFLVNLNRGDHIVNLSFEPWNVNMNVDVNTAMLDCLRVIRMHE